MAIEKSSRHSKVIGEFGEAFLCNWLSRAGFEVTVVDHTGLDVVAYHPRTKRRLGITVKARTRHRGSESTSVTIFKYGKKRDDRRKLLDGCEAFGCEPWAAVYVETEQKADLYLTPLENYDRRYRVGERGTQDTWKMSKLRTGRYVQDPDIWHVSVAFQAAKWSWPSLSVAAVAYKTGHGAEHVAAADRPRD
jgi:hypothetical protein